MQSNLLQPDRKLRFTEKHFQGFWVQLKTLIRRNEHADEIIDGIMLHPILEVLVCQTAGHPNQGHAEAVRQLYIAKNLGMPVGDYPTAEQLEQDPIRGIRDFTVATTAGTDGGRNPVNNVVWIASRRWARVIHVARFVS